LESGQAEKHRKPREPSRARVAPPQPAGQLCDRPARAGERGQPPPHASAFLDHATSTVADFAVEVARFVTSVDPATRTSIPLRRTVE
jgi:hypothetical protein